MIHGPAIDRFLGRGLPATTIVAAAIAILPAGCGDAEPEARPPRTARSDGPTFDPELLQSDPDVVAFQLEATRFLEIVGECRTLEAELSRGRLSPEDTERWHGLQEELATERGRLNNLLYDQSVDREQRAAMWWVLRGAGTANPATTASAD